MSNNRNNTVLSAVNNNKSILPSKSTTTVTINKNINYNKSAVVIPARVVPAVAAPLRTATVIAPTSAKTENAVCSSKKSAAVVGPAPVSEPAAYLLYEPDSSGRLVEHYVGGDSMPVSNSHAIIGRWTAGNNKTIATFKLKRNAGRNVLQGNCSAGVQGRRNYCSGWCQFVKSAFIQQSDDVTLWDPTGKGMMVDVYLYYDDNPNDPDHPQTVKLVEGVPTSTRNLLAVAAIPKNTPFYERHVRIGLHKWLQDGNTHGYSSKI
jgi:Immune Mapped Protein 2 (IMP2) N-terminal domain